MKKKYFFLPFILLLNVFSIFSQVTESEKTLKLLVESNVHVKNTSSAQAQKYNPTNLALVQALVEDAEKRQAPNM